MQKLNHFFRQTDFVVWAAILFSISFSLGIAINTIAFFIFLSVGTIATFRDLFQKTKIKLKGTSILLIGVFIIIALREFIINEDAIKIIAKYSPFLLVPLIVTVQGERLKNGLALILKAFLIGCLISAVVNLSFGFYRGVIIHPEGVSFWYFTYDFLAEPFSMQPIYLAFFYVFGLFVLNHYDYATKNKIFYYLSFFLLTTSVLLLAARNAILCLLVLLPAYMLIKRKLSLKKAMIIFGVFGACFLIALQNPVVKNRIFKANKKGNFYSGTSLRMGVWKSAYEASKENLIWGSGKTIGESLLLEEYKKRELRIPIKYEYNSHNQYLQFLVQYGIIGLTFFVLVIVLIIKKLIERKNHLGLFWVLLFSITAITESVLTRQWGILSFTFLTSLFLLTQTNKIEH